MVDFGRKVRIAIAAAGISEAELARRLETTPQAFSQRLKTGKFKLDELENIATALGAEFKTEFIFPDGTKV